MKINLHYHQNEKRSFSLYLSLLTPALAALILFSLANTLRAKDNANGKIQRHGNVIIYESDTGETIGDGRIQGPVTTSEINGRKAETVIMGNRATTTFDDGEKIESLKVGPQTIHRDADGRESTDLSVGGLTIRRGAGQNGSNTIVDTGRQSLFVGGSTNNLVTATVTSLLQGSGVKTKKTWDDVEFDQLEIAGVFDVKILCGAKNPQLALEIDDNLLDCVNVKAEDSTLLITVDKPFSTKLRPRLDIKTKSLKKLTMNGQDNVSIKHVAGKDFTALLTGSGDLDVQGGVTSATLKMDGSGKINAIKLKTDNLNVTLAGAGEIKCKADKSAKIAISGAGDVYIGGNAKIKSEVTGAGRVVRTP